MLTCHTLCTYIDWTPILVNMFCRLCTLSFLFGLVPSGIAVLLCFCQMLFGNPTCVWYTSMLCYKCSFYYSYVLWYGVTFVHLLFHKDCFIFLPQLWCPAVPRVLYCHSMKTWKSLQLYLVSFLQYKIWNTSFHAKNNCLNITTLLLCFSYCIILLNQAACLCVCLHPRLLITNGMMWHDMDLTRLVKHVLQLLYANCSRYH